MYSLAGLNYTEDECLRMLKSNRTISYRYELLDMNDRTIGDLTASGSIDFNSDAVIKRAASLSVKEVSDIDFLNDRVKPFLCLHTPNGVIEYPLGVFLLSSPNRKASNGTIDRDIDAYDKMQILIDDKFDTRYLIPAHTNYIAAVQTILQSAGVSADITPSDKETEVATEYAVGTSKADVVNKLLKAMNYTDLWVDASGKFKSAPYTIPEYRIIEGSYNTDKQSIVLPGATEEMDIFNAPNKIVRYLEHAERGFMTASAVNDDPNSKLSTVSRGRTIVDCEAVTDIADQATLDAYVQRVAAEKKIYQYVQFNTATMPNHEYLDCYYIINKELNVSGKYIETAWKLDMSIGGKMSHTARKAVTI